MKMFNIFLIILFLSLVFMLHILNGEELILNLVLSHIYMINLEFNLNLMSSIFSLVVCFIGMKIIFYNNFYFHFEIKMSFKINFLLFIFSMLLLINSNSILMLIIGWDGLGISSFYLISFYSNMESVISSLITFFFNRLGDSFMMVFFSMMMLISTNLMMMSINTLMITILFIGTITKSSQIPFGIWLPMAMSAPTPISSLVHSSTLVTAGIFLLMKINYIFFIQEFSLLLSFFGLLTFLLGAIFSFSIMDFKKAVAFSTLSQLGFILFSYSIGNYFVSYLHLLFHAFFKSSIFMNLGLFMNLNFYMQESRIMNFFSMNKIQLYMMMFSCLNLMGLISTSGFISKDYILMMFFNNNMKMMILFLLYIGCMGTCLYCLKFIFLILMNNLNKLSSMFKIKLNILMFGIVFSFILMSITPIFIMDYLLIDMEIFFSKNMKLTLFNIIIFSLILSKMFLSFFFYSMKFSSMMMMLEYLNFMIMNLFKFKMFYINIIMMIDLNQISIIKIIFNKNMMILNNVMILNLIYMIFLFLFLDFNHFI